MISHGRIKTCKAVQDEASFHQREQVTRDPLIAVLVTRDRVISSGIPRSELMGLPAHSSFHRAPQGRTQFNPQNRHASARASVTPSQAEGRKPLPGCLSLWQRWPFWETHFRQERAGLRQHPVA